MVKLTGRIQSRMYEKKYEDGTSVQKVAYEVSIAKFSIAKVDEENVNKNNEKDIIE